MINRVTIGFVCLAFVGCGPDVQHREGGQNAPLPTTRTSPSALSSLEPSAKARPIRVSLPARGFAVSNDRSTWLVDVEGKVVRRLSGFTLAGNPGNAGVWVQRGRVYFRVQPDRLEPVERELARDHIYEEEKPDLRVPPGGRYKGMAAGSWRYAVEGPGAAVLGQWSGECEVPHAFWIEPGRVAVLITGGAKVGDGPESIALGWAGRTAFAFLGEGACGGRGDPPGIYAFDSPGEGTLIYRTPRFAQVDMWGG